MIARLSTGGARLDQVLGGGLPEHAITMVIGLPGSGKTILAHQCVHANATVERPALYLSTVSEPLEKILHFGQSLSFFDAAAVGSRIIYEDLGLVLADRKLTDVRDRIRDLILEYRPGIMVIDSFKGLHAYTEDASEFRQFLHSLAGTVSAYPITSLWLGEYDGSEIAVAPEFAVADAIVSLSTTRTGERSQRSLRVLKLRGGAHMSGGHMYRISEDGIAAYPRLADPVNKKPYDLTGSRHSSGIQALDDMLGDGYWPGASTLIAGPTGAGKTLMGLHFLFDGVNQGECGLIATLQENPTQLERIVRSFGWSLNSDSVALMYRSPVDLYLDEWVYGLLDMVESTGATRVMIDSLGDLQAASVDPTAFREYIYSLLQRLSQRGVSLMMSYEISDLFGVRQLGRGDTSHLADNVVLLQYADLDTEVARTLTVLKTRASNHDPRVRRFEITADGITLLTPVPS